MNGSLRTLAHVKEVTWNTNPGTAFTTDPFLIGSKFNINRTTLQSEAMVSDRSVASIRLGAKKVRATLPFELSYGTWDDHIETAMHAEFTTAASASLGAATVAVSSVTKTLTASTGTPFTTLGILVGDWVNVRGFLTGNVANNGYHKVTVVADAVLTFEESITLVTCTGVSGVSVEKCSYVKPGVVAKSLCQEFGYIAGSGETSFWMLLKGMMANSLSLSFKPDALLTGSFDMVGGSYLKAAAQIATSYSAASSELPMDGNTTTSVLYLGGVASAIITGLDLSLSNGSEDKFSLFSPDASKITSARSTLTGTATGYLLTGAFWDAYLAETPMALTMRVMNPGGTKGYAIDIPNLKFTNVDEQPAETDIMLSLPWTAQKSTAQNTINWRWTRLV